MSTGQDVTMVDAYQRHHFVIFLMTVVIGLMKRLAAVSSVGHTYITDSRMHTHS